MAKPKKPTYFTPVGTAVYPWLTQPDTKFNADGEYKVNLKMDEADAAQLHETLTGILDTYWDEFIQTLKPIDQKKWKKADVMEEVADDNGDSTGELMMKFKLKATVRPKGKPAFTQKPLGFDAGKPPKQLDESVAVFGGSKIKVQFEVVPYDMSSSKTVGLSYRIKAFQVIELSSGNGSSAPSGFESVEGGFVSTASTSSANSFAESEDDFEQDEF